MANILPHASTDKQQQALEFEHTGTDRQPRHAATSTNRLPERRNKNTRVFEQEGPGIDNQWQEFVGMTHRTQEWQASIWELRWMIQILPHPHAHTL